MKNIGLLIIMAFIVVACSQKNGVNYFPIEKFEISNGLIEDSTIVYILYASVSSGGESFNYKEETKFLGKGDSYVQLVVHTGQGDTFNILTPVQDQFTSKDHEKEFYFRSIEDQLVRILFLDNKDISNAKDLNNRSIKEVKKVLRDPNFDKIADNNYPTTLGVIERRN
ncbi:MAG: hypothetical protein JXQ87_04765 [Bacteroidia bacterium]